MIQYVTMPIEILQLDNLSLNEKFILSLAKTLKQGCFLSNQQIATMLGISKGRVSHLISKLVREGHLNICLEYKENSKEVAKRTITFVENVKEAVKTVCSKVFGGKNKELKNGYVATIQTVGTEQVEQIEFGKTFYQSKPKKTPFTTTYSHNWDIAELERREMEYVERLYGDSHKD